MGLCYPEDTSYAMGGMKAFSQSLLKKCTTVFFKNKVKKIIPINDGLDGFQVITDKDTYIGSKVISTIPIWNQKDFFEEQKAKSFFENYPIPDPSECWSAFMIYLTIPLNRKRKSLYYQIHTNSIPNCNTHSFFVSLSHPDDSKRSINSRQVVTISTHTKGHSWPGLERNEYQKKKEETANFILNQLKLEFNLDESEIQNVFTGSPTTFIKYTSRYQGLVGGIPHSLKRNPLSYLIAKSPYKNFYMIGDTQYPGQGIASVILGAQNLTEFLND
jgi:phytoene dehydrogenase-like protein